MSDDGEEEEGFDDDDPEDYDVFEGAEDEEARRCWATRAQRAL